MSDTQRFGWGNIDVEFDALVFAAADVEAATRDVDRRLPGFSNRVPPGTFIVLDRHGFSGEYTGSYQVGAGRPSQIAKRAWSARRAVNALVAEIASLISAEISPLRPKGSR